MALEWFELDLLSSGNPGSCPLWMDDWTEFVIELQSTFGPHNPVTDAENQLDHLQMKENQCINKYMDKICRIGKPCNLDNLHYLAQEIDMHYWEHKEEVQHANKSSGTNNFLINKPSSSTSNSGKGKPTTSNASSSLGNTNSLLTNKPKSSNTGKVGKDSKLTLEEKKQCLDNKLCMFCGDNGHFSNNCPKKANKGKTKVCTANATQSPQEQLGSTSGPATKAKK
ncbi:hypothetical protein ID866_10388 [Astraeus odoratus]|nr:hypothetical protein ID866_10388 [Astraeus odoratus]